MSDQSPVRCFWFSGCSSCDRKGNLSQEAGLKPSPVLISTFKIHVSYELIARAVLSQLGPTGPAVKPDIHCVLPTSI